MISPGSTTDYRIRDTGGRVRAVHVREDKPDGTKAVRWHRPDGTPGLNGTPLHDLPLYGAHELGDYDPDELVALVEGEKARDALAGAGIPALGTVTGASSTPSEAALEVLRDRRIALWPDHDEQGRDHMHNVAQRLHSLASEVLWFDWPEAENKGDDAADHPATKSGVRKAIGKLRTDLDGAPRWKPPKLANPLLESRVLLSEGMVHGIEPPEELEPGVLLKGKVHWLYAPGGAGKTMLMLWLVKRCIERGENVLLLDAENGRRIISERLELMGVDPAKVDDHLYYLSSPSLTIPDQPSYLALLDEVEPALVVFDSLISFIAGAGCEENSNTDVAVWAGEFCHPARARDIAVLLIDHVPHDGAHARGATRKRDEADVQWKLNKTQEFDRESVGEIVLFREKDREAWLPPSVKFSVGGSSEGFIFARSEGTLHEPGPEDNLSANHEKALAHIRHRGDEGATWSEILAGFGGSKGSLGNALKALRGKGLVYQDEKTRRHHAVVPTEPAGESEEVVPPVVSEEPLGKPDSESTTRYSEGTIGSLVPDESVDVQEVHTPYGCVPLYPDVVLPSEDDWWTC